MFIDDCKVTAGAPTATGTSTILSAAFDMAGFEGIRFVVRLGTPALNNIIKATQCDTVGGSYADLLGSAVTHATNNQLMVDIARTREQFVQLSIARGTSTTIDSLVAIQYGARTRPVTQPTSTSEKYIGPAEGTA